MRPDCTLLFKGEHLARSMSVKHLSELLKHWDEGFKTKPLGDITKHFNKKYTYQHLLHSLYNNI